MIRICIANRKGGVSKTTTAVNMSSILAEKGYKVLLIDLDPQGNATQNLGLSSGELKYTIYDVLINNASIYKAIYETEFNVDVVGANDNLSNAEIALHSELNRDSILSLRLSELNLKYDYILLDLPPELGTLSINGLVASDYVIIPIDVGRFSLTGINELTSLISLIKKAKLNEHVSILGILLTKIDNRTNITKKRISELHGALGDIVFNTQIRQNVKIIESQNKDKPINHYDKECSGYTEYDKLVEEVLENVRK